MDKFVPFTSTFSAARIFISVPDAMLISLIVFIVLRIFCFKKNEVFAHTALRAVFCLSRCGRIPDSFPHFPNQFAFSWQSFASEFQKASLLPFFWSIQMFQNGISSGNMSLVFTISAEI